jgi:hypothetical protein
VPGGSYALRFAKSPPDTLLIDRVLVFGLFQKKYLPAKSLRLADWVCVGRRFVRKPQYEAPGTHPIGRHKIQRFTAVGLSVSARKEAAAKLGLKAGRLM